MNTITTTDPEALAFARAIDTEIADLSEKAARLQARINEARRVLAEGDRRRVNFSGGEAALTARVAQAEEALSPVFARLAVLDRIYGEHRWSRFYLVRNNNGHIHRSMDCHTTFPTTQWGWLPQLSGLTEAEAVADQGEILCSVCYPLAPIAWCNGRSKAAQEAAAERAAAKAERAAKKAAKALYSDDPDRQFRTSGRYPDRIGTLAAAKSWLTDGYVWGWDHPSHSPEDRDALAALLAERLGTTPAEELAAAQKRAAKRR